MDTYDIFKRLTTNLSFSKQKIAASTSAASVCSPIINNLAAYDVADAENNNKKQQQQKKSTALSIDDDDSGQQIKILSNLLTSSSTAAETNKQQKNKKTSDDLKKIMQIHKENLNHLKNLNHINVNGNDVPDPIELFSQLASVAASDADYKKNVSKKILENLLQYKFDRPTPIQMQVIPVLLSERELMACAPTGSGKTIAFLFPLLCHLAKEPQQQQKPTNGGGGGGIRGLILAPTRELARQIYLEALRLAEGTGVRVHLINKTSQEKKNLLNNSKSSQQKKRQQQQPDLLITTPIKLIHLMNESSDKNKFSLSSVEWLIIDEADKLFEEAEEANNGFREQLGLIYKACDNPHVKHGMFSATYTHDVEEWCKLNLNNMIQVSIGRKNLASYSVEQEILYVGNESGKLMALRNLFKQGFEPPILVFVQSKERANDLFKELLLDTNNNHLNVDIISADRTQAERDNTIRAFRQCKIWVLICTELMSRGIDFKGVKVVINYDFPQSAISYVHRIGRSGRAGRLGKAITFFTDQDLPYLKCIANIVKESGGRVPDYMLSLKKPSKRLKRELLKKAPKRKRIPLSNTALQQQQAEAAEGVKTTKNEDRRIKKLNKARKYKAIKRLKKNKPKINN